MVTVYLVSVKILGIETSCDETAAAVVEDGHKLLSNVVASSLNLHVPFGGVVPEIAARSHLEVIIPVINQALTDGLQGGSLQKRWDQIDKIAVTQGPGLLGSLLIGVLTARTLAIVKNKPLIPVNHVEAHIYAAFLTSFGENGEGRRENAEKNPYPPSLQGQSLQQGLALQKDLQKDQPEFPILALIVSGGHTSLVLFKNHGEYRVLGQTLDDAVGEAFDKVAKMLGLPYPGGPSIAKIAKKGDPNAFNFPKSKFNDVIGSTYHSNAFKHGGLSRTTDYRFSFSGLKTAVLRAAQVQSGHDYTFPSVELPGALNKAQKANLAASFQKTAVNTLVNALAKAEKEFKPKTVVVAGGVAANEALRQAVSKNIKTEVIYPAPILCTDNAAMIAANAFYKPHRANPYSLEPDSSLKMMLD